MSEWNIKAPNSKKEKEFATAVESEPSVPTDESFTPFAEPLTVLTQPVLVTEPPTIPELIESVSGAADLLSKPSLSISKPDFKPAPPIARKMLDSRSFKAGDDSELIGTPLETVARQGCESDPEAVAAELKTLKPFGEGFELQGIMIGVHGKVKVGKTHFGLTGHRHTDTMLCPASMPFIIIDTHFGVRRAAASFPELRKRGIDGTAYEFRVDPIKKEASGQISKTDSIRFVNDIDKAVAEAITIMRAAGGGMLVFDTWSDYHEAMTEGVFAEAGITVNEAFGGVDQKLYAKRNRKMKEVILLIKSTGNSILVGRDKQEYVAKGTTSDIWYPYWAADVSGLVDFVILVEFTKDGTRRFVIEEAGYSIDYNEKLGWEKVEKYQYDLTFPLFVQLMKNRFLMARGIIPDTVSEERKKQLLSYGYTQ